MYRRPSTRLRLLLAAVLAATVVVGNPAAGETAPPDDLADDTLRAAVAHLGSGQEASAGIEVTDGRMRVEILHHSDTATVTSMVEAVGGTIDGDVPGVLAEGEVPWTALADLEATEAIDFIRPPESISQPIADSEGGSGAEFGYSSQELRKTGADTWHQAGHRGEGMNVGIIDVFSETAWDRAARNGEVPQDFFAGFCQIHGSPCSIWNGNSSHGVAVAEVVTDMAPYARLYLARVETTSDLQAAMDWFAQRDVRVVTRSLTSPFDGPGDGTGPIATVIDNAVAHGITFVQAAGNASGGDRPTARLVPPLDVRGR